MQIQVKDTRVIPGKLRKYTRVILGMLSKKTRVILGIPWFNKG